MTAPTNVATAAYLVEQYRQAQVQLSARTMRDMIAIWPLLLRRRDREEAQWLALALRAIRRDRAQAARYAADFASAYRYLELGPRTDGFAPRPALDFPTEQVTNSLMAVGPKALSKKVGQINEQGRETARFEPVTSLAPGSATARVLREGTARAAQRHVVNGGRDTLDEVIRADPEALGYVRITDGDPCHFCALLSSRGAVYREDSLDESDVRFHGPGNSKVHDGCQCQLIAVYDRKSPILDRHREFEALWYSLPTEQRNLNGFRRKYEGRG